MSGCQKKKKITQDTHFIVLVACASTKNIFKKQGLKLGFLSNKMAPLKCQVETFAGPDPC